MLYNYTGCNMQTGNSPITRNSVIDKKKLYMLIMMRFIHKKK